MTCATGFASFQCWRCEPTAANVGEVWRRTNFWHHIPGLPYLVFTPSTSTGPWIVDEDRRYSRYNSPYPRDYLDDRHWVREPWSGRVVALNWNGAGNVNVLKQGDREFTPFPLPDELRTKGFYGPYVLPNFEETLVTHAGDGYVVGQNALLPWVWNPVLKENGIKQPSFHFSKELGATVILNSKGSRASTTDAFVLSNDGKLYALGRLETERAYVDLLDLKGENSAVLLTASVVVRIDASTETDGAKRYSKRILHMQADYGAGSHFVVSKLHNAVLHQQALQYPIAQYSLGQVFFEYLFNLESDDHAKQMEYKQWYLVNRGGLSAIPGGKLRPADKYKRAFDSFLEFPELGISFIEAADGLHWFDGKVITLIPNSSPDVIGKYKTFVGPKSIGRLILRSEKGLFEFTKTGPKPLFIDLLANPESHFVEVKEWPETNVVLLITKSGLFALDGDLNAVQITDYTTAGSSFFSFVGINPGSVDMIMDGEKSLFVVVDTVRNGKDICRRTTLAPK